MFHDELKESLVVKTKKGGQKYGLTLSHKIKDLNECNFYIVTVPTPIDDKKNPDLRPLVSATKTVAKVISLNDFVVYESTVFPGATEEVCVPIIERESKLKLNLDFFVGYSPERINPGDKKHTISNIVKIVSGSNKFSSEVINSVYKKIIQAGTYLAPNIKVAEAAKVIENSQRDINIAFVNELSKIFNLMEIDTREVLKAASTKWNFLNFEPGLVGGHCIGVDPYYLASKSISLGYKPEIILSGRRVNDSMGPYVAKNIINFFKNKKRNLTLINALILGVTFKENCPDTRNSKVFDIISELEKSKINITVYDPWVDRDKLMLEYNLNSIKSLPNKKFDVIVLAVKHNDFSNININGLKKVDGIIYDLKGFFGGKSDFKL